MPRFRFQIRTVMNVIAAVAVLMAIYRLLPGRFRVILEAGFAGVVVSFVFCAAFLYFYSLIAAITDFLAPAVSRRTSRSQARLTPSNALDQLGSGQIERSDQHDDAAKHTPAISQPVPNKGNV